MRALNIVNWDRHFETCESKRIKTLSWVAIPNSMDGRGYLRLTKHKSVVSTLAGWYAIVQIGSKMPHRGLLAKVNGPLSAADLSDISRLPEEMFTRAIAVLMEPDIGWLEWVDVKWENDVASIFKDGALQTAGHALPTDRTDRPDPSNKSKGVGPGGAAPDQDWKQQVELEGGVVYGKADPQWRGLIGDYGLKAVLSAMRRMKASRDGSQSKAAAVRSFLGKNKPQAEPPRAKPGPERTDDEYYRGNAEAAQPLERIAAFLARTDTAPEIQDAIAKDPRGAEYLKAFREGKRTALMLRAFLRLAPSLQAVAYPPMITGEEGKTA